MEELRKIRKRDGSLVDFEAKKILLAMQKAFISVNEEVSMETLEDLTKAVEGLIAERFHKDHVPSVEEVQDLVEFTLIDRRYYSVVKAFILYRSEHNSKRKKLEEFKKYIKEPSTLTLLKAIAKEFTADEYDLKYLYAKLESFAKKDMKEEEYLKALVRGAAELTAKEAPNWEFISARFLRLSLQNAIERENIRYETFQLTEKIKNGSTWAYMEPILEKITAMQK